MHTICRIWSVLIILSATTISTIPEPVFASSTTRPLHHAGSAPRGAFHLSIRPARIDIGRDVTITVIARDTTGAFVDNAVLLVSGAGQVALAITRHGQARVRVHAVSLGAATLTVSHAGYAPARVMVPIIAGPPAIVLALKRGLSVLAPGARLRPGIMGQDLFARYHAVTAARQLASLGLRDGTLVDLNSNTDVLIKDPLHTTLNAGELFLEVVHGDAQAHTVQAGTAVAATNGTRLDVRYNRATRVAVVTVVEGLVRVTNKGATVLVGAAQQTTVPPNAPPRAPIPASLSTISAWLANLSNSTPAVVPPIPDTSLPISAPLPFPGIAPTPTLTITAQLESTNWSGVVRLNGDITIPATGTVTIQPGTTLETSGALTVRGTLLANGTAAAPIVFTGLAGEAAPASSGQIVIDGPRAGGTRLSYVHDFNGYLYAVTVSGGASPSIAHSAFIVPSQIGMYVDDTSLPTIADCLFAVRAYAISVPANAAGLITGTTLVAGQLGIEVRDSTISRATTWHRQHASFTFSFVTVAKGVTLTIEPGVIVEMVKRLGTGATLTVEGVLKAGGTAAAPIVFTSAAPQPQPGDWRYIVFSGSATSGSTLTHVLVFYAGGDIYNPGAVVAIGGASPTISTTTIAQAPLDGIYADDTSRPVCTDCVFAGITDFAASVPAEGAALIGGAAYAAGQQGIEVRGNGYQHTIPIARPVIWPYQSVPYVLDNGVVTVTASLTLEPGTVIEIGSGRGFDVSGTLLAVGHPDLPITFTSIPAASVNSVGGTISFHGQSASRSVLRYVHAFHGYAELVSVTDGAAPSIADSVFAQSSGFGIHVDDTSRPSIAGCVFADLTDFAIWISAEGAAEVTGSLLGAAQQGIEISGAIRYNTIWHYQDAPFVISVLDVAAGATLTIAPGLVVAGDHRELLGGFLTIEGTLLARGTTSAPITFTTDALAPHAGNWEGIRFDGKSASESRLDHVIVTYGGSSGGETIGIRDGASPFLTNSSILSAQYAGISVGANSAPTITGCYFRSIRGPAITIPASDRANIHDNTFAPGQQGVVIQG